MEKANLVFPEFSNISGNFSKFSFCKYLIWNIGNIFFFFKLAFLKWWNRSLTNEYHLISICVDYLRKTGFSFPEYRLRAAGDFAEEQRIRFAGRDIGKTAQGRDHRTDRELDDETRFRDDAVFPKQ